MKTMNTAKLIHSIIPMNRRSEGRLSSRPTSAPGKAPLRFSASTRELVLGILTPILLGALSSSVWAAEQKAQSGPQRPPFTDTDRLKHIPPLPPADKPLVSNEVVFQEVNGLVVIEAEHFNAQRRDMIRRWYLNSAQHTPTAKPDGDPVNVGDAGGGAYMEALPDTFVTDDDRPIDGLNLGLLPGSVAVLCYKVSFSQPGRYYLWTRMRSDDEEDNTLNAAK